MQNHRVTLTARGPAAGMAGGTGRAASAPPAASKAWPNPICITTPTSSLASTGPRCAHPRRRAVPAGACLLQRVVGGAEAPAGLGFGGGLCLHRQPARRLSTRAAAEPAPGAAQAEFWSVVIPTYNRLPILTKALRALEDQDFAGAPGISGYEVVVVDDGSSDGTVRFLNDRAAEFPHVRLVVEGKNGGAARARNTGVAAAAGAEIVFIDSDLVVTPTFLRRHAEALATARARDGDDRAFTYGRVVNTSNLSDPTAEPFKLTDMSAAFFATGNVAISRARLLVAGEGLPGGGPFDCDFSEYGWEDLELGERLRQQGAGIVQVPEAVGFHYHPAFSMDQLPALIEQERQRGRGGVCFYQKHPSLRVRLMIQLTWFHYGLWFLLTLGGRLTEGALAPMLRWLCETGRPGLAAGVLSPTLNWHTTCAARDASRRGV